MKKLIVTCALFLVAGRSFAQNDFAHAAMDSLQKILYRQKSAKDSLFILQKMADFTPIRHDETSGYPNHIKMLLDINKKLKLIDPAPYLLLQQGNAYLAKRQYAQSLRSFQAAVTLFDKQRKVIYPLLVNMRVLYNFLNNQDDRLHYFQQQLENYLVNGPYENTAPCYHAIAGYYLTKGAYNQALTNYMKGGEVFRRFNPLLFANINYVLGVTYSQWGNLDKARYYEGIALPLSQKLKDTSGINYCYFTLSQVEFNEGRYDEALKMVNESIRFMSKTVTQRMVAIITTKAAIYLRLNQPDLALPLLDQAKKLSDAKGFKTVSTVGFTEIDYEYYAYYLSQANFVKAERSLLLAYQHAIKERGIPLQLKYLRELGYFYQMHNQPLKSEKYFEDYFKVADALEKGRDEFKVAQFEIDENDRIQRAHIDQLKQEKAVQVYELSRRNMLLWGSLVVLLLISGLLVFIFRQLQINKKTLMSLRETQTQLVQSEKMASLGELTAGIAHEIQNPLNFVNNFSEVNKEMIGELIEELNNGNLDEVLAIAQGIEQNEDKINHHGKRADSIVKGMLQHSRPGGSVKEPTDINALAEEYMRLAYNGLRAKNKNFNAELITKLDPNLPKVNVVPQDIGRVMLNLFNNAFYAVNQKAKTAGPNYLPIVAINSFMADKTINITVKDNGSGIPDAIKEKVMQPFFTTKPTGEGTGLGLSLTYDMVVKGHGGSIQVNSVEGEGAEFIISLPMN